MTRRNVFLACAFALVGAFLVSCGSSMTVPNIDANSLAKIVSPETSLDDFKGMLGDFGTEQKKKIGDAIYNAAEEKFGVVSTLKSQLNSALPMEQINDIKGKISSATGLIKGLQGKLDAVVGSLTGEGLDLGKWAALAAKAID